PTTRMCAHPSCVSDDVVTYEQLKDMMSTGSVQLFDVREPDELEAGFIPGASNIPLGDVEQALRLNPDQFRERYGVPKPGLEDSDLVLYCQRGIRSLTALETARDLGYKNKGLWFQTFKINTPLQVKVTNLIMQSKFSSSSSIYLSIYACWEIAFAAYNCTDI
uniref:Rhodanese domain-containing protein n=1 Tax=Cyprinus carpio carpio TaxID=630221 RepID=A0A8C1BXA1_CYPCA